LPRSHRCGIALADSGLHGLRRRFDDTGVRDVIRSPDRHRATSARGQARCDFCVGNGDNP